MPLITIRSLAPSDPSIIPRMIADIRDTSAHALKCPISNIWVIFQPITPGHYIQGEGDPAQSPQQASHPPVVVVRANVGRSPSELKSLVSAIAEGVGRGLSVPSKNVWIHYQEMRPQDIWFDGHWSG